MLATVIRLCVSIACNPNFKLGLPHSIEVVVWVFLIGGNLSSLITVNVGVSRSCINKEVCGGVLYRRANCVLARVATKLMPAFEGVSFTSGSIGNINCFVDLQRRIRLFTLAILSNFIAATIVFKPDDVRRRLDFLVLVYGLQLDGVIVFAGINDSAGSHNCTSAGIRNFRIALENLEGCAGKDGRIGVYICAAVPGLQHPVVEHFSIWSCRSSTGANKRTVFIKCRIRRSGTTTVRIVNNTNAIGTNDNRTPLGIEIVFFCNPETINIGICRSAVAPLVHGISHVGSLIVRSGNRGFVQNSSIGKRLGCRLVCVPAIEFIACTLPRRNRNLSTVRNAEVHPLGIGTPAKRSICTRIGV